MKRILSILALMCPLLTVAQSNLNDLLAAGIEDAQQFTTDYLSPLTEGAVYSISGSWYNTAEAKPFLGFEIQLIGNTTFFNNKADKKAFLLNTADYENLRFVDGSSSREVASALGDIEGVRVFVEDDSGLVRQEFELPSGLASEGVTFLPSGYIQASVGLIKGTEIKARFLPKINADDAKVGFYGFGLQHEFTKHLPADKLWPVAVAAVIGYTHLDGDYNLQDAGLFAGEDQRLKMKIDSWVFQAVVSTRLPVINFYGGLGYLTGKANTDVLGTYVVSGPFPATYTDPFSVRSNANGVVANLGAKLKLGFFRLNVDYTLGEFDTASFGINFGFR